MQVHPVVSRLCAPIEGTDAAHLADCLGLDPAKFRQQVNAASGDAREEAQLAAASVFDDDDRYKARTHNLFFSFPTALQSSYLHIHAKSFVYISTSKTVQPILWHATVVMLHQEAIRLQAWA